MAIKKEDIEAVGKLARVKIFEEEIAKFTSDLDEILNYVKELEEAPSEGVILVNQISNLENIAREDEINESLTNEKVLENAPGKEDGFIKVKKVFE